MNQSLSAQWFQWSNRQRMSPFPNYLSMESISNEMGETLGAAFRTVVLVYQKNLQTLFVETADRKRMADHTLGVVKGNPQFFQQRSAEIRVLGEALVDKFKELDSVQLRHVSNREVAELFEYYQHQYKQIYSRYFPILCIEEPLGNELKQIIEARGMGTEETSVFFTTLTTQPKAMVSFHEEMARLAILEQIVTHTQWQSVFERDPQQCLNELESNPRLADCFQAILNHQAEYYWITRDYEDPHLTIEDVVGRLCTNVQQHDLSRLQQKRRDMAENDSHIVKTETKLDLTEAEKRQFALMRDGMYNKEQRKTIVSKSLYHFDKVLEEVSGRVGLPLRLIRFMKMDEVLPALEGKIAEDLLEQRFNLSVWIERGDAQTTILIGEEAKQWEKQLFFVDQDVLELKGVPISHGVVIGRVKLMLHPDEGNKVQSGDIIVTIQAVPSFSQAISRAAGILADGGTGLTSHTATLAREAKIPGITSLKNATKILKDGDIVEVNGGTGLVRILKKFHKE